MVKLSKRLDPIKPSPTLTVTAKAAELRARGIDIISLSAGEPDFDTPPHIVEAAKQALDDGKTRYTPAAGIPSLREAIAAESEKLRGVPTSAQNVIVTVGAKHALFQFFQAVLNEGDEVVIPAPYWVSYPDQVLLSGGVPVFARTRAEDNFVLTPSELERVLTPKTKAIVLNSPSNPTGAAYSREATERIVEIAAKRGLWIVSDEIYRDLLYDGVPHVSVATVAKDVTDKVFVVDGVSKTYAMTGWRIGWGIGHPDLVKAISMIQGQSTSNTTSIAQVATLAAIEGPRDFLEEWKRRYVRRRDLIVKHLSGLEGVDCVTPQGAFYVLPSVQPLLERVSPSWTDVDFASFLLEKARVAVVPGTAFGAPGSIRLSYAAAEEAIEEALVRIERAIHSL